MSKSSDDSVLALTARIADGEAIDWAGARRELPAEVAAHLEALDALYRAMRRAGERNDLDGLKRWGHLHIVELIGDGGYGQVYRAFDPVLQREVALKLRRADAPGGVSEWIREARRLARVRHPNVLAVHGADTHESIPGLWADLIQGQTLADQVRGAPLSGRRLLETALHLASAVAAVHDAGLVHGDIKPGNVMLEAGGGVVLMDFGTARDIDAAEVSCSVEGSPLVMAPETLAGKPATPAADVYALGAVLHFAATGRYPFEAATLDELRQEQKLGYRAPRIRPRAMRRLIQRMLEARAERRPEIGQVSDAIRKTCEAPRRHRRYAALAAIMLLLAGGLAVASIAYYRIQAAEAETSAVNALLVDTLNAPRGTAQGRNVRVSELLGQAVETARARFDDQPLALARVQALAGQTYESLGRYDDARPLLEQAIAIYREHLGADNPRTVEILDSLARTAKADGDAEQARAIWREMLDRSQGATPSILTNAISARIGLADLERDANRLDEAERLLRAAIDTGSRGTEREVMRARSTLVQVLAAAGRYAEANSVGQAALEDSLRINGARHVNTLIARDALVWTRNASGQHDEAERLARDNLAVALDWLGAGDRHTVMAQNTLSNVLHDRGQLDESLQLLRSAVAGAEQASRAGSNQALTLQVNLVARYLDLGRFDDAVTQARRTAALVEESAWPTGQLAMINGINLAEALLRSGHAQEALTQARAMQDLVAENLGDRHPFFNVAGYLAGAAMTRLGRAGEALDVLQASHQALGSALDGDHPLTLDSAAFLAECLLMLGRVEDARALALETRAALIEAVGPEHLKLRLIDELIARIDPEAEAGRD